MLVYMYVRMFYLYCSINWSETSLGTCATLVYLSGGWLKLVHVYASKLKLPIQRCIVLTFSDLKADLIKSSIISRIICLIV